MKAKVDASEGSGRLALSSGRLTYSLAGRTAWTVRVSDMAIVGEYTTDNGPYDDDYFFVFITRDALEHEASFYAGGRDVTLAGLWGALGTAVRLGLVNSTDFASRILWPETLRGRPLYDFREVYPPGRWRWLRRLLRLPHVERSLTATVVTAFGARGQDQANART